METRYAMYSRHLSPQIDAWSIQKQNPVQQQRAFMKNSLVTIEQLPDGITEQRNAPVSQSNFVFSPIRHWARTQPNKPAVIGGEVAICYRQLEETTNQLARALRYHGVQTGDRVVLVLPRGVETVLVLIAVLKAGATYVPLDAESPAERLQLCIEDTAPQLVIRATPGAEVSSESVFQELSLSQLLAQATDFSAEPFLSTNSRLHEDDIAYIIFTSGTTGRPKGVPISHRSLTNFVAGNQEVCIRVGSDDRVFQGFSPASDGHHEEVWPTFAAGATLVVATSDDVHSGQELESFLLRHQVSIISCAPTLLSMIENDIPCLHRILVGAERCPAETVRRWWRPGREIINTYGPTEATVGATFAFLHPDEPVTIGQPLPNYYCYIVDSQTHEVLPGQEGELCIAGVGVSDGYLGNALLTTEKFLPNPYALSGRQNEVLYRTGDRARRNADGNIEWLGRIDAQVKVRGYRIELSDIESHLLCDDSIRSAVAILRGTDTLVALVVPKSGRLVDPDLCLTRLRNELPAYMIPQAIETVDALPVLPSGKIDRHTAQSLQGIVVKTKRTCLPPRTANERLLFTVWEALFPNVDISRTDDFFLDRGGYSLLATRFTSVLRHEHGLNEVSVRDIYEHPILEQFAAFLDAKRSLWEAIPAPESSPEVTVPSPSVPASRYALATFLQGLGILFLFGIKAVYWLLPIVGATYCDRLGYTPLASLVVGLFLHAISIPLLFLFAIATKWIVIGRFRAGTYPIWSTYFVRWWLVQRVLDLVPHDYLTGTPLASLYLRLLGAGIGSNVTLESLEIDCPDLLEIGSDSVIDTLVWLRASHIKEGQLILQPIQVGRGCELGVRSGVAGGTVLEEGVRLADLSCAPAGSRLGAGEEWVGSPARPRAMHDAPYDPAKQSTRGRQIGFGIAQGILLVLLAFIEVAPFYATTLLLNRFVGNATLYLAAPVYSILYILTVCVQILTVKWSILGRVKPGEYPVHGTFALRKWFVDKLLDLQKGTIMPLYDTLYTRPWCSALGMKCGPRTEIALPSRLPYDLIELREESFLASDVSIGLPRRRNGQLILASTVIGKRSFIGNNSVVPQGTTLPDDSLLGALSVCPHPEAIGNETGQSWLGSPAFKLNRRQHFETDDIARTYRPSARLYAERLVHETLRIILPSLALLVIAFQLTNGFFRIWQTESLPIAFLSLPFLYLLAALSGVAAIWVAKKVLIGTYKPTVQPLWSRFVWNTESFAMVFHDFGTSLFVSSLLGSPYMAILLRFLGANVGRRAYIETCDLTEVDLITIGEDTAINFNAPLQAHLFEDRVMKVGRILIGDRCSVGIYSVVLFESEMQAETKVGHISLVMRGETLPAGTQWEGAPAQPQQKRVREALRAHA